MARAYTVVFRVDGETLDFIDKAVELFERPRSQLLMELVRAELVPRVRAEQARRDQLARAAAPAMEPEHV